uniref:RRM domain-containing protein n=1 Tax=Bos taurus TaxID=9913 RepID=G5E5I0_BOVIN
GNPLQCSCLENSMDRGAWRTIVLGVAKSRTRLSDLTHTDTKFCVSLFYKLNRYREIVNINLVPDKKTGKSKGFCFLCYEDQRSTILAVDSFNGIKIKGRTIRVDHVSNYRLPEDSEEMDEVTRELQERGCGTHTPPPSSSEGSEDDKPTKKHKKGKWKKRKKKERQKTGREVQADKMIKEKDDPGSKKHSGKHSEKAEKGQKSESREVRKSHPSSAEVRTTCRGRMEDREREPRKEKSKHEHKSSSRREEREDRHRERDRGRSSDIHSRWHDRRSEGRHDRCSEGRSHRSRSRHQDKSHRHKRSRHSRDPESSNPRELRHH